MIVNVSIDLSVLRSMAKEAIERALPEDEHDYIPDWCYDTILQTALVGIDNLYERGQADQLALDAPYMQHKAECALRDPANQYRDDPCTCGLDALRHAAVERGTK